MRTVAIVQARIGSARLPGKVMLPLAGAPLIGRLLQRVMRCTELDEVVLAVPATDENVPLAAVAQKSGVSLFMGQEDDCLDRTYQCAVEFEADVIVRIPGDNPCVEPSEVDKIIQRHRMQEGLSFSTNIQAVFGNGYPDGIGAEVFPFALLERVWKDIAKNEREHVAQNFFDYRSQQSVDGLQVNTVLCPNDFAFPALRLDVNTRADYDRIARMYGDLYPDNNEFTIMDIVEWHRENGLLERQIYPRSGSTH